MERCPNCRARWEGGETCRRCGMDLGPLLAVEQAAEALVAQAVARLARGEAQAAIELLSNAWRLKADPGIGHLRGFAQALCTDPEPPHGEHGPSPIQSEVTGFFEFRE